MTISHKTTARQLGSILLLLRVSPMTLTMPMMIGMPSQGLWIAGIAGTVISVPLLAWMAALCTVEGLMMWSGFPDASGDDRGSAVGGCSSSTG